MTGAFLLFLLSLLFAAFRHNRVFYYVWAALFLFMLGFTAGQWRTHTMRSPVLHKKAFDVTVRGRVTDVDTLPNLYRITMDNLTLEKGALGTGDVLPRQARVRLKAHDKAEPMAGDVVSLRAVLLPLSPPVMPGAFDFQRYAFFKGLGATGYALGDAEIVARHEDGFFFARIRRYVQKHIEADIADKGHAAVITAFMVGDSAGIPQKIWDICRMSGIAHLIAISGSHFMLIAGFAFFIVRAFLALFPVIALRWPIKKIAALAAMGAAVFYMLLIGAPIPAQRAALSACVIMAAIMLNRDPFTLRLVSFSALAILLSEPESLMGASFQMSYAAVIGIVAFYEATREKWRALLRGRPLPARLGIYLAGCFATTLIASLSTGAYALYNFSRMPLLAGLAANMFAVPLSSFVTFPIGLLACLLMPFGLDKWPMKLVEQSVDVILQVAGYTAAWPYAMLQADAWSPALLTLMTLGGLWVCVWRGRLRLAGVLPILAAALLIPQSPRPVVLASDTGKLFAVRDAQGVLWFSSKTREKFTRRAWADMAGGQGTAFWPKQTESEEETPAAQSMPVVADIETPWQDVPFLGCGDAGDCYYRRADGLTSAFLTKKNSEKSVLAQACAQADIVFTVDAIAKNDTTCARASLNRAHPVFSKTLLVDKWDMYDNGAYAVYVSGDEKHAIDVRTVRQSRGHRPWTIEH